MDTLEYKCLKIALMYSTTVVNVLGYFPPLFAGRHRTLCLSLVKKYCRHRGTDYVNTNDPTTPRGSNATERKKSFWPQRLTMSAFNREDVTQKVQEYIHTLI